jgi:hypothetical protein
LHSFVKRLNIDEVVSQQRKQAKARMQKDLEIYSRRELQEIETLYQVANKKWKSEEGKKSLEKLIEKYNNANRTGCALLYLGQMSIGKERENYLMQAIKGFSDCFYGDGVQVGAYARYYLAHHYNAIGNKVKSETIFQEIRKQFPYAINHKGELLSDLIK